MIPRLKPYLGWAELVALCRHEPGAVARFEAAFAHTFESQHALAFPYGRSALWACFKALGIEQAEIIMPAYTCVVVAHAIVLSGNVPRFVDCTLHDYNMDLDQVAAVINERTRAIVATHLFGYPLDVKRLNAIVSAAEARYGHKIWIIQDCAHAFGARWQGQLVCNAGDVALFGLNISKLITAIFGGMLTTNDAELAGRLRAWRDEHFCCPGLTKDVQRRLYALAVYPAFRGGLYGLVHWLQEQTPILNRFTRAYHLDEKIHFPPDYLDQVVSVEAQVGLAQLRKYQQIVQKRQETAHYYTEHLRDAVDWELPPLVEGATYSHYVVRVTDRERLIKVLQHRGIQLGRLIEYSVPHIHAYERYAQEQDFPNSRWCSQSMINLPVYAHLPASQRNYVVEQCIAAAGTMRRLMPCMQSRIAMRREYPVTRMNPIIVDVAQPDLIPDIARIHAEALPDDFLPSLGTDFLELVYYPQAIRSKHATTLVACIDEQSIGFVTIAHNSIRFNRDVLRDNLMQVAAYAVRSILRNPGYLVKSLEVFWSAVATPRDPILGEIAFIAVEKAYRGRGVGKQLVGAALDYLRQNHIPYCRTKTLAKNSNVIKMYEGMGWHVREQFRLIGREYVTIASPRLSNNVGKDDAYETTAF